MGRIVEGVGWLSLIAAVIIGIIVGSARDEAIYSVSQVVVRHPVNGFLVFLYLAFGALLLLIAGRAVALFAEHVARAAAVDLDS